MARRTLLRRHRLWPLLLAALVAIAALLWWSGRPVAATAVAGGAALAGGFVLGVSVLRAVLSPGNSVVGVARTVVEEAVGTRVPLVLLVLAATGLPALPLVLDPTERLEYRMQFFLNWGLSGTGFLLALVTLVLACGSVCGDIDTQRIHMTLAKPIQRWQYLLGKWLGIVLLDLVLVALAGIGIYAFTQALRQSPELDRADRRAVEHEVLAARSSARPEHPQREDHERAGLGALEVEVAERVTVGRSARRQGVEVARGGELGGLHREIGQLDPVEVPDRHHRPHLSLGAAGQFG
jgi:hypothetical protein